MDFKASCLFSQQSLLSLVSEVPGLNSLSIYDDAQEALGTCISSKICFAGHPWL